MNEDLVNWRKKVDDLDEKILKLLATRISLVKKIGRFKKDRNLPALDEKRWGQMLNSHLEKNKSLGLSKRFIKDLLTLIHIHSIEIQNERQL